MQLNRAGPGVVVNARNAAVPIIRPILRADESDLQRFIRNLSPASRYLRFMRAVRELPEEILSRFANPEPGREAALVASSPFVGIIGLAQYVADKEGDGCEVAIVVSDAWQRQGLGSDLLTALMVVARCDEIGHAHADVFADNHAMRALARKLGCELRTNPESPFLVRIFKTLESPRSAPFGSLARRSGSDWRCTTVPGGR
ncbi:MAG: GNAT family N-acetyltransferase [Betaproteobacteria bacterium]|nr:GNAT family N-acetyltransferase [Betaproteobacteria bacterium]